MGIHVKLSVLSTLVDPETWSGIYDESVAVLKGWPDPPMCLRWRPNTNESVAHYSLDFEQDDGWKVDGDMRSRRSAESFWFPRSYGRATNTRATNGGVHAPESVSEAAVLREKAETRQPEGSPESEAEILLALHDSATTFFPETHIAAQLFGNKTQGRPYHKLIVAIGTLVENRLPRLAAVSGDLSQDDGAVACRELERILGGHFKPPVVFDKARLRARLMPHFEEGALEAAVKAVHVTPLSGAAAYALGLLSGILDKEPTASLRHDLEVVALTTSHPKDLGEPAREFLIRLLGEARKLEKLLELDAKLGTGAIDRSQLLEAITRGTLANRLQLTELAWNEITSADEETLCALVAIASLKATEFHVHHAVLALLENPALRGLG